MAAQSFADWERQLAISSVAGGVLGTPTSGPSAISKDVAGSPLYAQSITDLISKMQGSSGPLQGFYDKGLTPDQVLFGQTSTAPGTHEVQIGSEDSGYTTGMAPDRPSNDVPMPFYGGISLKNPNDLRYDPNQGVISPEANIKQGGWDKFQGDILPMLIMSALTIGGGEAIGAVGGAGGMFSGSNLLGSVPKGASFLGNLGDKPTSGGGAPNPLLAILQFLSQIGKGSGHG